jgi:hypothetical protein
VVPRVVGSYFYVFRSLTHFQSKEEAESSFHVLRYLTRFRRYRGHRVQFLCFALPDPFSEVNKAPSLTSMFCAPGLISGGTEGSDSIFNVLHSRTHFGRYRGHRVQFSCFELPNPISAVLGASGLVFMFCATEVIFGDIHGVVSNFYVLRSQTSFWR